MGYFLILRPLNCLITAASVMVGAWIGLPKYLDARLLLAMIAGFLACGFGNVVNDLFDIDIDAVSAPQRPLPTGKVKRNWVVVEAIGCALVSLILAAIIDGKALALTAFALILLLSYAGLLKKYWLANIVVALLAGFSFLLGGIVRDNIAALFPFALSVLVHMPREIIKDLIDEPGDRQRGIITCAVKLGSQKARNIAAVYLGILCLILPAPFMLRILGWRYVLLIMLAAIPLILYLIIRIVLRPAIPDLRSLSRLLKLAMAIGLIAMII